MISIRRALTPIALAITLGLSTTALAKIIVIRASGPSASTFKAGATLDPTKPVNLKAGDTLTLLDGTRTRTIKGPGNHSLTAGASSGADISSGFATLTAQRTERRGRIGAVRDPQSGLVPKARNPHLWYLDIERSGNFCVVDREDVTLWRPIMIDDIKLLVTPSAGGQTQVMDWSRGEATRKWPSILPVTEGATYQITVAGQAAPTNIRFALVNIGAETIEEVVARLLEKGCNGQVDQLIAAGQPAGNAASAR